MTEGLVPMAHVKAERFEHDNLEQGEDERQADDERKEQHTDTRIEGQYVAVFHQGAALLAELLSQVVGELCSVQCGCGGEETLELGSGPFLSSGI